MTTQELKKLHKLEEEVMELKKLVQTIIPLDTEGAYKKTFLKKIDSSAKEKGIFTYTGKGSLLKKLG